jgi:hypothetical protein
MRTTQRPTSADRPAVERLLLQAHDSMMRAKSLRPGHEMRCAKESVSSQVGLMLEQAESRKKLAQRFSQSRFTMLVGRGANVAVACEGGPWRVRDRSARNLAKLLTVM